MRVISTILGLALLLSTQNAMSAGVAGKVIVTRKLLDSLAEAQKKREGEAKAYYWNEPNGISPVRPPQVDPANDIGMVLIRKGDTDSKPDKLTTVKVRAGGMEPSVIVVRPGSTIRFRNVDPYEHELYVPKMSNFPPELQSNGSFRPIEFGEEGIFEVRCRIAPHFRAYVVVVKAGLAVALKTDGQFSSGSLEPGDYHLKVFHGGTWIHNGSVTIPEGLKKDIKVEVRLEPAGASAPAEADGNGKKEG